MFTSTLFGVFGFPGHIELIIVLGIALLLFGHRLPSLMRSAGRSVVEFKKGVAGIEDEIDNAVESESSKPDDDISKPVSEK
jgi:sec-independent protein translocase protein TatA